MFSAAWNVIDSRAIGPLEFTPWLGLSRCSCFDATVCLSACSMCIPSHLTIISVPMHPRSTLLRTVSTSTLWSPRDCVCTEVSLTAVRSMSTPRISSNHGVHTLTIFGPFSRSFRCLCSSKGSSWPGCYEVSNRTRSRFDFLYSWTSPGQSP